MPPSVRSVINTLTAPGICSVSRWPFASAVWVSTAGRRWAVFSLPGPLHCATWRRRQLFAGRLGYWKLQVCFRYPRPYDWGRAAYSDSRQAASWSGVWPSANLRGPVCYGKPQPSRTRSHEFHLYLRRRASQGLRVLPLVRAATQRASAASRSGARQSGYRAFAAPGRW